MYSSQEAGLQTEECNDLSATFHLKRGTVYPSN